MDAHAVDLKGVSVLLVDDVPANLEVLRELLEAEGYEISVARDGATALRIVQELGECPELILLDVMMPGMDGYQVCQRLKADAGTRDIPVVFITAQDEASAAVRGFACGGVDYIAKPFRGEEVMARRNQELEEEIGRREALSGQLSMLSERETQRWALDDFVGHSPTMQRILAEIMALTRERP